jgi:hypothetical protein
VSHEPITLKRFPHTIINGNSLLPLSNKLMMKACNHRDLPSIANVRPEDDYEYNPAFERPPFDYINEWLRNPAAKTHVACWLLPFYKQLTAPDLLFTTAS